MDTEEESNILLATGCTKEIIDRLLDFAGKYRQSISAENVLKSRRLGTRSLVRITRKLSMFPNTFNLNSVISQSLLAEFLPTVERLNLNTLLEESNLFQQTEVVCVPRLNCLNC